MYKDILICFLESAPVGGALRNGLGLMFRALAGICQLPHHVTAYNFPLSVRPGKVLQRSLGIWL